MPCQKFAWRLYTLYTLYAFNNYIYFKSHFLQKHQEWLNRHKLKTEKAKYTKWKSSFELANLWRINKEPTTKQNSSINDVYTESETSSNNANIIGPISTQATRLRSLELNDTNSSEMSETWTTEEPQLMTKSLIAEESTGLATEPLTTTSTTTTTTTTTRKPKLKGRPFPRWANWSPWSECSRSCGGGIMHQTRKCIDRWVSHRPIKYTQRNTLLLILVYSSKNLKLI